MPCGGEGNIEAVVSCLRVRAECVRVGNVDGRQHRQDDRRREDGQRSQHIEEPQCMNQSRTARGFTGMAGEDGLLLRHVL